MYCFYDFSCLAVGCVAMELSSGMSMPLLSATIVGRSFSKSVSVWDTPILLYPMKMSV
jgi:hypothetical protein